VYIVPSIDEILVFDRCPELGIILQKSHQLLHQPNRKDQGIQEEATKSDVQSTWMAVQMGHIVFGARAARQQPM